MSFSFFPQDPFDKLLDNFATNDIWDTSQTTLHFMTPKQLNRMKNHYLGPICVLSHSSMNNIEFDPLWPSRVHLEFNSFHMPKQGLVKPTQSKLTKTPH